MGETLSHFVKRLRVEEAAIELIYDRQKSITATAIDQAQYREAWDYMYKTWLPESGYQPDDRPPVEVYLNKTIRSTSIWWLFKFL